MSLVNGSILMYHSVLPEWDRRSMVVSLDTFKRHMKYLSENKNVISIDDYLIKYKNNTLGKNDVVITFDDGFKNNIKYAVPVLEKYKLPAIFYVTTGYVTGDMVDYFEMVTDIELDRNLELMKIKQRKIYMIDNGIKNSTDMFMNVKDLKTLNDNPLFTIGSHTLNHPTIVGESFMTKLKEIYFSKRILNKWIDDKVNHFCYPYGGVDKITIVLLILCGYKSATIVGSSKRKSRYLLHRVTALEKTNIKDI